MIKQRDHRVRLALQSIRHLCGMTVGEMASEVRVSRSHLSEVYAGDKNATLEIIKRHCDAIGLTISQFFAAIENDELSKLEVIEAPKVNAQVLRLIYTKKLAAFKSEQERKEAQRAAQSDLAKRTAGIR